VLLALGVKAEEVPGIGFEGSTGDVELRTAYGGVRVGAFKSGVP
jgi:hypothetical protein